MIKHSKKTGLISFKSSLSESINNADIIFITVGTPSKRINDEADLSAIWSVVKEVEKI